MLAPLAPAQTWLQLSPSGPLPSVRAQDTAVYDANTNTMIVFGGYNGSQPPVNEVWLLKGANGFTGTSSWLQLSPSGTLPPGRRVHTSVYDAANNRMITFGGTLATGGSGNDVWVLTNANGTGGTATWIPLSPTGTPPTARRGIQAVYDANANRMIVFGGQTSTVLQIVNEVWVLTNANGLGGTPSWIQLSPSGSLPPSRWLYSAVYDASTNRMIIFGGDQDFTDSGLNEVWVLTNANGLGSPSWINLLPNGTPPSRRALAFAAYDTVSNRMTIYGGQRNCPSELSLCVFPNDVWVLQNANGLGGASTWTQLNPSGAPVPRTDQTGVYDPGSNRLTVFGGFTFPTFGAFNDSWVLTNANGIIGSQLQITQILPNHGGNSGTVTARIIGSGFQMGATVKLSGLGPDILGTNNTAIPNGSVLATTFNLQGATVGGRNLVVTNPDNTSVTLPAAFTVEDGGAPQIWVDIIGFDKIRIGRQQTYYLVYGNSGNVDAPLVQCWVTFPTSVQWSSVPPNNISLSSTISPSGDVVLGFDAIAVGPGSSGAILILLETPTSSQFTLRVGTNQQ